MIIIKLEKIIIIFHSNGRSLLLIVKNYSVFFFEKDLSYLGVVVSRRERRIRRGNYRVIKRGIKNRNFILCSQNRTKSSIG